MSEGVSLRATRANSGDFHTTSDGRLRIRWEEEAEAWLWAEPGLLQWPDQPIVWIATLVTGRHLRPGDMWGLDARGELVIVEFKLIPTRPFWDFYCRHCGPENEKLGDDAFTCHRCCETATAKMGWQALRDTWETDRAKGRLLPRSRHSVAFRLWPDLATKIRDRVETPEYASLVRGHLNARRQREAAGEKLTPHYVGVLARRSLGVRGRNEMTALGQRVGPQRVHLFDAYAHVDDLATKAVTIRFQRAL